MPNGYTYMSMAAYRPAAALGARKMSKPQLLSALNLPRNYPLSKSTALCVNTAFAYPYYILPILYPRKKSLGLSPAIFGIMQSVMHGVIVSRIAGGKYSPGFLASFFLLIPLGVTYIRALKAAEGLTRGNFTKSAAYSRLRGHRGRWPERRREEQEHPVLVGQGTGGTARC